MMETISSAQPYSKFALVYDKLMNHINYEKWARFIIKSLPRDLQKNSVLDLACGTGQLIKKLSDSFKYSEGIDLCPEMLERAKSISPNLYFQTGDISRFETERKFDLIVCTHDSFNYLKNDESVDSHFKSVHDSLSQKGFYFFDVSSEYNLIKNFHNQSFKKSLGDIKILWENRYDFFSKEIISTLTFTREVHGQEEITREIHVQRYYSTEEIISKSQKFGFEVLKIGRDYQDWTSSDKTGLVTFLLRKV